MNADDEIFSSGWDFLAFVERVCRAVFMPLTGLIKIPIFKLANCFELCSSPSCADSEATRGFSDLSRLAQETAFTENEAEELYKLFKKLGNSMIRDNLIHKEELQLALFQTPFAENLLLDRVFDLFDENKDGVIEFEEFIRMLSVFHPNAPKEAKIEFAFGLFDIKQTGYIERDGVKRLLVAVLMESEMKLPEELLEAIIDKTFKDADVDGDGRISRQEWKVLVGKQPSLLRNMTLQALPSAVNSATFPR